MSSWKNDPYDLDDQIGFRLRLALQVHSDIFFKTMQFGLTQAQYATLARLMAVGPCSQNQLGRLVALDSASILGVVSRLKARDLVRTARSQDDRRRVMVELTSKGRTIAQEAISLGRASDEATLKKLSKLDRLKLIKLLKELAPESRYSADLESEAARIQ